MMAVARRLPEVRTLAQILPKGTEGGKEFARIVDMLLFFRGQKEGRTVSLFSDRAGDFRGLDSYEDFQLRRDQTVGYQYKFFNSPLSNAHRQEIEAALAKAKKNQRTLKLVRWVLVTPDDLVESGSKKGGGDVDWFQSLAEKLKVRFTLEHWGHRKLQALFLDAPRLALFYYPELVPNGEVKFRSLDEVKRSYDKAFANQHNRIEFVGMSVYKPEATRGVPIEDIYIPVSAVPIAGKDTDERVNPLEFLEPGRKQVVLGDPGSGKSTLLKFLALVGQSRSLQRRYGSKPDSRLPIMVTLRKYADALKGAPNKSLLQFIAESIEADFSLRDADADFLESHLEAGRVILLFDGMDELPSAAFKETVRDRIAALVDRYPANTVIVTSRIVGYSAAFGFAEDQYDHFRLATLLMVEMDRFVEDWYRVRLSNEKERKANVEDLKRIFRNPQQIAIRTLAENPLLLTIVTLVHRIDAVLPDERVVLYQKCTETLLNTWQIWKFREVEDVVRRGRIERLNRRRIEALAHHMHEGAGGSAATDKAVLSESAVLDFLSSHICNEEGVQDRFEAQVLADQFASFVKQRAGLLIEVGDEQYSFVHLTFQEYLTATNLAVEMEIGGITQLWQRIAPKTNDPRWHEVIRLLFASLRSDAAQEHLLRELLAIDAAQPGVNRACLLGGLTLDGIACAETEGQAVCSSLLRAACSTEDDEELVRLVDLLTALSVRNAGAFASALLVAWEKTPDKRSELLLMGLAAGLSPARFWESTRGKVEDVWQGDKLELASMLLQFSGPRTTVHPALRRFREVRNHWLTMSPEANSLAVLAEGVLNGFSQDTRLKDRVHSQLRVTSFVSGPFEDYYANVLALAGLAPEKAEINSRLAGIQALAFSNYLLAPRRELPVPRLRLLVQRLRALLPRVRRAGPRGKAERTDPRRSVLKIARPASARPLKSGAGIGIDHPIVPALVELFQLRPRRLWLEALKHRLIPALVGVGNPYCESELLRLAKLTAPTESDQFMIASFLLHDMWIYAFSGYETRDESPMRILEPVVARCGSTTVALAALLRELTFDELPDGGQLVDAWKAVGRDEPELLRLLHLGRESDLPKDAQAASTRRADSAGSIAPPAIHTSPP